MKRKLASMISVILLLVIAVAWLLLNHWPSERSYVLAEVPQFSGQPYVILNDNVPEFSKDEMSADAFEQYADLVFLGRCGRAIACIGTELMPTQERGSIGQVKPSGWQTVKYDFVDGKYLYNRCHLIGFQLTGENANECNLITGTRYLNVEGMLPFENMIADYVKETGNHVLYRVTPIYDGNNLVASGVQMEAMSVEDGGEGICFHVYAYNAQPGVVIDYLTGESRLAEEEPTITYQPKSTQYILNTNSGKFHKEDCKQGNDIREGNRSLFAGSRDELIKQGYQPAGCCNP